MEAFKDNDDITCEHSASPQDSEGSAGKVPVFDHVDQTFFAEEDNDNIKCEHSASAQDYEDSGGKVPVFDHVDQTFCAEEDNANIKCEHSASAQDCEDSGGKVPLFDHVDQTFCAEEDNECKPSPRQLSMNSDGEQLDSAFERVNIPECLKDEIVGGPNIKRENMDEFGDGTRDLEDGLDLRKQTEQSSTFDVCDGDSACSAVIEESDQNITVTDNQHSGSEEMMHEYICSVCSEIFPTSMKLKRHMNKEHINNCVFSCEFCGKAFMTSSYLKRHILIHSHRTKSFKCAVCSKGYYTSQALSKHKKSHDPNRKNEEHQCDVCGKRYKYRTYFTVHMLEHKGEKAFTCGVCGKKFSISRQLQRHMVSHMEKKYKCRICRKRYKTSVDRRLHEAIHSAGCKSQCDICKRFVRNLTIHMRVHSGAAPFKCEFCGKGLFTKRGLTEHYALHTGREPWICYVCGRTLTTKAGLRSHVLRVHSTAEKIFFCKVPGCNKGFCLEYLLNQHVRFHSPKFKDAKRDKRKNFACDECHKVYCTKPSLDDHMNIHRSGRSFSCSECPKMCFTQTQLDKHMAFHNVKKSTMLGKSINQDDVRTDEEPKPGPSTHSGERIKHKNSGHDSFCPICKKPYRANILSVHVRTRHPGEKPFKCNICDEAFVVDKYLQLHIDKKH